MTENLDVVNKETGEIVLADQTMSFTIGKLAEALSKAQSEMRPAKKDAENPFFKSSYADLSSVWESARGPLGKHGLAVVQTNNGSAEVVTIITTLIHSSGEWIRGTLKMKPSKADPQGIGSCITYGRRYAFSAIVGVCTEDDDGNAASHSQGNGKVMPRTVQPQPKQEVPTYDYDTREEIKVTLLSDQLEEVPHTVQETLTPANVSPEGRCTFGKNKGMLWSEMTRNQLTFYRDMFMQNVNDPEKEKYKAGNEKNLQAVMDALEVK